MRLLCGPSVGLAETVVLLIGNGVLGALIGSDWMLGKTLDVCAGGKIPGVFEDTIVGRDVLTEETGADTEIAMLLDGSAAVGMVDLIEETGADTEMTMLLDGVDEGAGATGALPSSWYTFRSLIFQYASVKAPGLSLT